MYFLPTLTIWSQLLVFCTVVASSSLRTLPLTQRTPALYQNTSSPILTTEFGTVFDVEVAFANQTFHLLVDTGSSDTYVMKTGYQCINWTSNNELPREACLYSNKTYDISSTYRQIPDQIFGVQYGDGIASGVMAYEDITLAGVTVKGATVGIANSSIPMGDGVNSGVLGLGYPALTSAHPGNKTSNTTYWYNRLVYNPVFNTMYDQGLVEPYYSLTLARTPQNVSTGFGGYLTLGGLPPVAHSPNFSAVPVEITGTIPLKFTSGQRVRSYWTLTVSSVTYGPPTPAQGGQEGLPSTTNSTSFQAFVDSGNYFSFLPSSVVEPINSLFSPPATYNPASGVHTVDCSAQAPTFGLQIGNQTFFHNGADLIYQQVMAAVSPT